MEWDYGALEGRLTADIRDEYPDWSIWAGPWPGGETIDQVGARADRVIARCLAPEVVGDVLLFSHGHLLRVLGARWLGLPAASGGLFALSTATVSILGWDRDRPVIETWNEDCHLDAPKDLARPRRPPHGSGGSGDAAVMIAIFGGTGPTGRLAVDAALLAGHTVTAYRPRPDAARASDPTDDRPRASCATPTGSNGRSPRPTPS